MRLGGALLRLLADGKDRKFLHLDRGDRVQHVDLHELTLPGALAVKQGRQCTLEGGVCRDRVDQILARSRWRLALTSRR